MPEELAPDSLGYFERLNPDIDSLLAASEALKDRDVYDANGERLGRVTRCFVEGGRLAGCEIRLDRSLASALGVEARVATIKPKWVSAVGDDSVRLNRAAAQVLLPEGARTPGEEATGPGEGSSTFPRKTR